MDSLRCTIMATEEECLAAVRSAVDRFNSHDAGAKRQRIPARSVGVTILDLDVTLKGDLVGGYLVEVRRSASHQADIRLLCSSDDLVGMVQGEVAFTNAWATGRVRLDASFRDLLKLRSLL